MIESLEVGVDIAFIPRFKKLPYEKNQSFYKKIFSSDEIDYCLKFNNPYEHFAGNFAIKEAVIKSLSKKINYLEIQTSHKNSKPIVKLKNNSNYKFLVSVSHDEDYATAFIISEEIN
jgi:phosphopantetheine--protein transferase-like protein